MIPLTVVIPTYRRPEKLRRCLASLDRQTHEPIRVIVEEDERREFAIGIWNRLAPHVDVGAFVYICDDVELEPDCLANAAAALIIRWPDTDGVVGFHQVGIQGKDGTAQSAMGMIGARFLDRFPERVPFCEDYSRFYFDAELGKTARALSRFYWCRDARLTHYHPSHYREEMDETHRVVRDPVMVARDRDTWHERQRRRWLWGLTDQRLHQ